MLPSRAPASKPGVKTRHWTFGQTASATKSGRCGVLYSHMLARRQRCSAEGASHAFPPVRDSMQPSPSPEYAVSDACYTPKRRMSVKPRAPQSAHVKHAFKMTRSANRAPSSSTCRGHDFFVAPSKAALGNMPMRRYPSSSSGELCLTFLMCLSS